MTKYWLSEDLDKDEIAEINKKYNEVDLIEWKSGKKWELEPIEDYREEEEEWEIERERIKNEYEIKLKLWEEDETGEIEEPEEPEEEEDCPLGGHHTDEGLVLRVKYNNFIYHVIRWDRTDALDFCDTEFSTAMIKQGIYDVYHIEKFEVYKKKWSKILNVDVFQFADCATTALKNFIREEIQYMKKNKKEV